MRRLGMLVAVLLTLPRIGAAQVPATKDAPPALPRLYADVNLLGYVNPLGDAKTFENYNLTSGEVATFKATYPAQGRAGVYPAYVGGGFMLNRYIGVGASYSRMARNSVVNLTATVPHPTFFAGLATDTGSWEIARRESAVHISLAIAPIRSSRLELRAMGGPSFFTLEGDMVQEVHYHHTFSSLVPQHVIAINGISNREISGHAVGYHVGADVTYFVHRFVGIAGGIRYGRAIVPLETEPLTNIRQEFLVGSTTAFLGLRFRFGGAPRNN